MAKYQVPDGILKAQMASVLWLSLRTIFYIEMGYHRPSVSSRMKLAELQKKYREARCT